LRQRLFQFVALAHVAASGFLPRTRAAIVHSKGLHRNREQVRRRYPELIDWAGMFPASSATVQNAVAIKASEVPY